MTTDSLTWHDAAKLTLEGKGWPTTARQYDRLPAKAEATVPAPVWGLSRNSAGIAVRFETDAESVEARWRLLDENLAMDHMPAIGCSGLDLYVRTDGRWRWLGVSRLHRPGIEQQASLVAAMPPARRQMMLYLPLYNAVESLEIGVPAGRSLQAAAARRDKPVVIYGTSIVHGGCASRPGMAYPAILGRLLDRPVINLGFSGNGRGEPELARLLAEIDVAAYVLDPLPNMVAEQVAERIEPFVRILREARPDAPIVLVESIRYQDEDFVPARGARYRQSNAELAAAFGRLRAGGVGGLHLVPADGLLGDDGEATVDGTHPTDLGFSRIAAALAPVLHPLI